MTTQAAFEQIVGAVMAQHEYDPDGYVEGEGWHQLCSCGWGPIPNPQHRPHLLAHVAAALAAAGVGDGLSEYRACWKSPSALLKDAYHVTDYDDEHLTMFWEAVGVDAKTNPDRIYWVESRTVTDWTTDLAARTPGLADEGLRARVSALAAKYGAAAEGLASGVQGLVSNAKRAVYLRARDDLAALLATEDTQP